MGCPAWAVCRVLAGWHREVGEFRRSPRRDESLPSLACDALCDRCYWFGAGRIRRHSDQMRAMAWRARAGCVHLRRRPRCTERLLGSSRLGILMWHLIGAITVILAGVVFFFAIVGVFGLPAAIIALVLFIALAVLTL